MYTGGVWSMAKHKKAKHAAKESAAPSAHASRSKLPLGWIVGAVVVVVILFLLFKGKAPEISAPQPEPEVPVAPEEPVDEDEGVLVPSEVEIVSEKTGSRAGAYDPMVWEQGSFFGGIKCMKSTGFRTDVLEFQLKNKEGFPFNIGYVTPGDTTKNPVQFSVNGLTLKKGVQESCGTEVVESGATVTCNFEVPLRHYGPTGTKSLNMLQLKIRTSDKKVTSETDFYC